MDRMGTSGRYEPEWPPEHVWREVDQAARVWDKLQARGVKDWEFIYEAIKRTQKREKP